MFSYETQFVAQGHRSKFVRRSADEAIIDARIIHTAKYCIKMFWNCFSYFRTGTRVPIECIMNSDQYKVLLEKYLATEHLSSRLQIFQKDSTLCHLSKKMWHISITRR